MRKHNKILFAIILLLLINIVILNAIGKTQNEKLEMEQMEVFKAIKYVQEGKFDEGTGIFGNYEDLDYKNSYIFNLYYARGIVNSDNDMLVNRYLLAYNIYPRLLLDQAFSEEITDYEVKNDK